MDESCTDCRGSKRVLTELSSSALHSKLARMAAITAPSSGCTAKAACTADSQPLQISQAAADEPQQPGTPPRVSPAATANPASPATPQRAEHRSTAHLLLKACEREEAAEERADSAEAALKSKKCQLAAAEASAEEAEAKLQEALERIKLLELQAMARAVTGSVAGSKMSESITSEQAASELQAASDDAEARSEGSNEAGELPELWPTRVATWDAAEEETEVVQLRLELEETNARLTMSREAEEAAKQYAEAAGGRLEVLAAMLRGAADVAFAGADTSSRRLRHHLFRCLDVDCDGFLGASDLQHWYRTSERFIDTQGHDVASFEALQAQIADALYNPTLPKEFTCQGKVSLLGLSRSKMGGGIVQILLNLDNLMQDRNTSEWGAARPVSLS